MSQEMRKEIDNWNNFLTENSNKKLNTSKLAERIQDGFGEERISKDVMNVIEILSEYNSPLDINVFSLLNKINKMTQEELNEFYESVSTNRKSDNSNEENFMLDIITKLKLNT